jgi:hypothetical protein
VSNNPFDLAMLKLTPEQITELAPFQKKYEPKPRAPRSARRVGGGRFVQLPYEYALAAAGRHGNAPIAVLVEVAYLAFKAHGKPAPLANKTLRTVGIDREAKTRALRQLAEAGLVRVTWRGRGKSPLVSVRWE